MKDKELLPCPFCGNAATTTGPWEIGTSDRYEACIECLHCGFQISSDAGELFDKGKALRVATEKWNRRAPAAPQTAPISDELPQGFISDALTAAGLVRHGKQCKALADRLGDAIQKIWTTSIAQRKAIDAAPQPPEAAPVQMPEPAAWVYSFTHSSATGKPDLRVDSITTDRKRAFSEGHSDQFELYTEHQVRQLLAQHGIK